MLPRPPPSSTRHGRKLVSVEVDLAEVRDALAPRAPVLDVRNPDEYKPPTFPGRS